MDQKLEILDQLDILGIGFGPGITEPTDPRTDHVPYDITKPLWVMPVASDKPMPPVMSPAKKRELFLALYGTENGGKR